MSKPVVSLVMPVYNGEKHLREAIESILRQTFTDFELLVVDDASTDNTPSIIREYADVDPRVVYLKNRNGKGIAGGLNTGLQTAQGKFIARADADDINRPERLEEQVRFLQEHPEIVLVGGGYAPFNENGHRLDIFHPMKSMEIAWKYLSDSFFCHPTVMFRREVYEQLGGYPDVKAEDFAYFSRIVHKYRCWNLPKILIDYREHGSNLSVSNRESIAQSVQKTYRENYLHYTGGLEYAELFHDFHAKDILRPKDLMRIFMISMRIVGTIRRDYGIPVWNSNFVAFFTGLMIKTIKSLRNGARIN